MVTIITDSTESFSLANGLVYKIDLIVILILSALLIFKEFLMSYYDQNDLLKPDIKLKGKILYIAIIPFLYVFCYVLIYKIFNPA